MHIPDGWVDLPTSAAAAVAAAAAVGLAGRRVAARLAEKATTLPAVLAAYLLVAQVPAVPLGVGTSAHLVGTGLVTVLLGPSVAVVCVAAVVVVQALVLADGGVTALGLNLLANGVLPALAAAGVLAVGRAGPADLGRAWRSARRPYPPTSAAPAHGPPSPPPEPDRDRGVRRRGLHRRRVQVVAGTAAAVATLAAAATTATELVVGGTDVIPPGTVAGVIGGAHVLVALGEGVLTALVVGVVARLRPDLLPDAGWATPPATTVPEPAP